MKLVRLIIKNTFRNKLRTLLAVAGMAVAVLAFLFLRTILDEWRAGEQHARQDRMVVRNKVSFTVPMPLSYKDRIATAQGVTALTWAQWFGGEWKDRRHFFMKFAVDASSYFAVRPELKLPEAEKQAWLADRQGAVIGADLANADGFKVGDVIPVKGDIFPGAWRFRVDGIFTCDDPGINTKFLLFNYDYLNQGLADVRRDKVGSFWLRVRDGSESAQVAQRIDAMFENSPWETKTESERSFFLGFLSMASSILTALSVVSAVILVIMALVLANTIAMSVRERTREYAVLRCIGFRPRHLVQLIFGESLLTALLGGALGVLLSQPLMPLIGHALRRTNFFPEFSVAPSTALIAALLVVVVGCAAAVVPAFRSARLNIVLALRRVA